MPITIEPWLVASLLVAVLLCAFVNGTLGFGFAVLAINVLALALGPQQGVVVISLISIPLSGVQVVHYRASHAVWRRITMVVAAALLGTLAGTSLLVILPGYALSLALGLFTAYEVAMMARKERPPMRARVERAIGPLAGFTGGVASGALAAAGPVLGTYLVAIGLRGAEFAFAINLVFLGMGLVRLAALTGVGLYSAASVGLSALLLVPSFFGQQLGFHFRGRLPANIIQRVVLLALLVASLTLIWRGFEGSLAALGR